MQKIIDNEFYIERNDLTFLLKEISEIIPTDILMELILSSVLQATNEYIKIDKLKVIEFITSLDFIYDADFIESLSTKELCNELNILINKIGYINSKMLFESLNGGLEKNDEYLHKCLKYKLNSLKK